MSKHPSLKELNEYAGGSLEESRRMELAGHVDACPQCTEEVEESRMHDSAIRAGLKMMDGATAATECLSPVVLSDYHDGFLVGDCLIAAERHLAECPLCRKSLIEMHSILEQRHKGELADLDEFAGARALRIIAEELGTRADAESGLLICMACRQPIPANSRFCQLCGAAIAPQKKNLDFVLGGRRSVSDLIRAHIWLVLSLTAIGASLFLERYFIQCVAVALVFGVKWILSQAQFRIYRNMIKSLKGNAEPEKENTSRKRKAL